MEKNTETDMIEQNMSLVKKIVSSISINLPRCIDRNELYSNGLLGLLHATRKFKPNPKASFKTYATIRIRGSMIDGLRRSYKPHKKAGKVRKIFLKLELEKGRNPTDSEMAEALKITISSYQTLKKEIKPPQFLFLDTNYDESDPNQFEIHDPNQENPRETIVRNELSSTVKVYLKYLSDEQQMIIALYYFENMSFNQIGLLLDINACRTCQILHYALRLLRQKIPQY